MHICGGHTDALIIVCALVYVWTFL